jgi:alkylated DNA repair dioxygenase AlkB
MLGRIVPRQLVLGEVADRTLTIDLGRGAWLSLSPGFVPDHAAVMERLVDTLPLVQEHVVLFGRSHPMPRLTSWHGDPGLAYAYSGRVFDPSPWTPELLALRDAVREHTGTAYNSLLANWYRDGRDAMGMHADDEPELGPSREDVRIASISLGERRRFVIAPRRKDGERRVLELGEGDLLVMGGTTQRWFRHGVPRTARPVGARLNLTLRVLARR